MLSISTTTRPPRGGEQDGIDYFFVSHGEFLTRVQSGRFLEHAEFNGRLYGTELHNIERARAAGRHLLFDIDVQGVMQLQRLHPESTVTIFVLPPSLDVLRDRLRARGAMSEEEMNKRLEIARGEIRTLRDPSVSNYLIINDDRETGIADGEAIIRAELLKISRHRGAVLDKFSI